MKSRSATHEGCPPGIVAEPGLRLFQRFTYFATSHFTTSTICLWPHAEEGRPGTYRSR